MKSKLNPYLLVLFFSIISIVSCNRDKEESFEDVWEDIKTEETSVKDEIDEPESLDLPASKYFKVTNIIKAQYLDAGKFEMELEVLNISEYKFSHFSLSAYISYKMKNVEKVWCEAHAQQDDIKPAKIKNWLPNTVQRFKFKIYPGYFAGCGGVMSYNRTPENISLGLKPFLKAISLDEEVEGEFVIYDLLPLWKEKQSSEGLR